MARDDDVLHEVRAMRGELGAIQIEQARQGDEQRRQGERIAQIELVVVGDGGEDKSLRDRVRDLESATGIRQAKEGTKGALAAAAAGVVVALITAAGTIAVASGACTSPPAHAEAKP